MQTTDVIMKNPVWIVVILLSILISSCAPTYVPNVRNAPLFRGAGEFQGSVHFGQGVDAQAAVSVTNHIGLMGNYEFVNRNTSDENDRDNYIKHKFWEGGVGYFENAEKISYEIFGGYGKGEGTAYDNYSAFGSSDVRATGTYSRIFIQPSVGSNHRIFNWIVSARISHVDFDKIINLDESSQYFGIAIDPDPVLFIEPAFTGRVFFGKSPIYSQFQTGFTYTTQGDTVFDYTPFFISFGFGLRFGGTPKVVTTQQ